MAVPVRGRTRGNSLQELGIIGRHAIVGMGADRSR
jgi:hypothetical protein